MRNFQVGFINRQLVVKQQVDVYRPVIVDAVVTLSGPSQFPLYPLGNQETFLWCGFGLHTTSGIQERMRGTKTHGFCFHELGDALHRTKVFVELVNGFQQQCFSVAQVAAQSYVQSMLLHYGLILQDEHGISVGAESVAVARIVLVVSERFLVCRHDDVVTAEGTGQHE